MNRQQHRVTTAVRIASGALATTLLLATATVGLQPAWADDAQSAHQLVEKARLTLNSFQADPRMGPSLRALVGKAKGVMIYPQVLRGAFLFGGAGGQGVFLVQPRGQHLGWPGFLRPR
jgi:lipid-binding SYLF domain-containing protein